jgi:Na+/melibiose symporter-like transporter
LPGPRLYAYGALAMPLAMLMLPVYVLLPKFYVEQFGLALGTQGALLLAARTFDAVQDPLLGQLGDRAHSHGIDRRAWILGGAPLLAAASYGLFAPPAAAHSHIAVWFIAMLLLVYAALSLVQISYQAYGAELSVHADERTRITAIREGLGLLGVLAGVLLPAYCATRLGARAGYGMFAFIVAGLLLLTTIITVYLAPAPARVPNSAPARTSEWRAMTRPLANPRFRALLKVWLLNGTANAIPATLVLFYIEAVIGRADLAPAFLCTYFLAGALAMPLWPWLARRCGQQRAWLTGMLLAIAAFLSAALLGAGDVPAYFAVCLLSGVALGADLALPPALLAAVIDSEVVDGRGYPGGAYFGLWTLVTKLNLALAAGLALPLLAVLGYGSTALPAHHAARGLALLYALLPCVLKALACVVLLRATHAAARPARLLSSWP